MSLFFTIAWHKEENYCFLILTQENELWDHLKAAFRTVQRNAPRPSTVCVEEKTESFLVQSETDIQFWVQLGIKTFLNSPQFKLTTTLVEKKMFEEHIDKLDLNSVKNIHGFL